MARVHVGPLFKVGVQAVRPGGQQFLAQFLDTVEIVVLGLLHGAHLAHLRGHGLPVPFPDDPADELQLPPFGLVRGHGMPFQHRPLQVAGQAHGPHLRGGQADQCERLTSRMSLSAATPDGGRASGILRRAMRVLLAVSVSVAVAVSAWLYRRE